MQSPWGVLGSAELQGGMGLSISVLRGRTQATQVPGDRKHPGCGLHRMGRAEGQGGTFRASGTWPPAWRAASPQLLSGYLMSTCPFGGKLCEGSCVLFAVLSSDSRTVVTRKVFI